MLLGMSLSRCIRDIVLGKVDPYEVICIITRTDFNWQDSTHQENIWECYHTPNMFHEDTWHDLDKDAVFSTIDHMWTEGKIHQPRQFNANPGTVRYHWLSCIVPPELSNPGVQQAWEDYKLLADLTKENFYKDNF